MTKGHAFPAYLGFMHKVHRLEQHPSKYLDVSFFLPIYYQIGNPGFNLVFLLFSITLIFKSNIQKVLQTRHESLMNIFAVATVSYICMPLIKSPTK